LLQTKGLVSSSSSPELLESMLVNERLDLVKLALKHIHDLTERDLVRVLCYVRSVRLCLSLSLRTLNITTGTS
jgi:hypothetical protein